MAESSMTDISRQRAGTPSRRRVCAFRAVAILIGFSPLLVGELVLRVADRGRASDTEDPFVGFADVHPLFVKNTETGENPRTHAKSRRRGGQ